MAPPYSPQLNVVEGLGNGLNRISLIMFSTVAEIRKNVHAFMENINPMTVIDWLCVRMESKAIQENLEFNLYRRYIGGIMKEQFLISSYTVAHQGIL